MAPPFLKTGHGRDLRFSFRRRKSGKAPSSPLSVSSSEEIDPGSPMESSSKAQTLPCARRALSRSSCGSRGKLSVDLLPPPLAGGPSDAPRPSTSAAPPPKPAPRHEGPPSDAEIVRDKFSKLLLGEDMSGTGKGVSSALALSNAITNLAASVFGEQRRLQPMAPEQKARWTKEIDWLLSVADHIVEFVPSRQVSDDGSTMEIMMTQQRKGKSFANPKAWLFEFLSEATDIQRTVLCVGLWHIWTHRNGLRNGETCKHPTSLADQCVAYVEMIESQLYKPSASTRRETSSSVPRWSPPPEDVVQIFADAALFPPSRKMGIGVVIRNHHGECPLSCSEPLEEVTTPEIAEALALRRAMTLARAEDFDKVVVTSDCLSLILRINESAVDRSQVGVVVQDIKALSLDFSSVSFTHVLRQCNVAAHTLARSAESFISVMFRNSIPDCIRQTICNGLS